jgi:hypothetical protein
MSTMRRLSSAGPVCWLGEVIIIASAIACAAEPARGGQDARSDYVDVGEGLSSQGPGDSIEAEFRMFSVPDFDAICRQARAADVVRLRSHTPQVRLRVGERFPLRSLKIVALDASGSVLPKVPIAVEVAVRPSVFELRSDRIADGSLTATSPGRTRLRIRTICDRSRAETFVPVDIRR